MSETYKIVYLNLRALAEPIRLLLQFKEIPYEDVRVDPLNWTNIKKDYKWGQLPELHINGEIMITQAAAISRYLARKFDLMPSEILDATRCDEIVDAIQDLRIKTVPFLSSKYFFKDGKDVELLKPLLEKDLPLFLNNLEILVLETQKASGSVGDFICGNMISWADFWVAHFTSLWEEVFEMPDMLKEFPKLKKCQEAVLELPQIKKYIENRAKTVI